MEPTDFVFRTTSSNRRGKVGGTKPDIVLMHKEDRESFLNCRRPVGKRTRMRLYATKEGGGNCDKRVGKDSC